MDSLACPAPLSQSEPAERQRPIAKAIPPSPHGREELRRAADARRLPDVARHRPEHVDGRDDREPEGAYDPRPTPGRRLARDAVPVEKVESRDLAPAPAAELHPPFTAEH